MHELWACYVRSCKAKGGAKLPFHADSITRVHAFIFIQSFFYVYQSINQ